MPDRQGNKENVVLSLNTLKEYEENPHYIGAVIGRTAGRIKSGMLQIEGRDYTLTANEDFNHLHGGNTGFSHVIWNSRIVEAADEQAAVEFTYRSPDGEEGYPGNLEMKVTYTLTHNNELIISYQAVCDKDTMVNPTNHSYFNLSGDGKRPIRNHKLQLDSSFYLEIDEHALPTGEISRVEGTAFDMRGGKVIDEVDTSIEFQSEMQHHKGFDHPFVLDKSQADEIILSHQESGRRLIIQTTEPAVIVYTGNKIGYSGICLETQSYPDSIRHSHFPSSLLKRGEVYHSKTRYLFEVMEQI